MRAPLASTYECDVRIFPWSIILLREGPLFEESISCAAAALILVLLVGFYQGVSKGLLGDVNMSFFFGLEHSNKDFETEEAFGKNTFTTAFPVALANYLAEARQLPMNYIVASVDADGNPTTQRIDAPLSEIWGCEPASAYFGFEDSFEGYTRYATGEANRSDLVVRNAATDEEVSAFEVKLVAVPTSGTAQADREHQCCELVVRPPSIEQLCFSVAASFGPERRQEIGDSIVSLLRNPIDWSWDNEDYMKERRSVIVDAANEIIRTGIESQKPFVLVGEWRTENQKPVLDPECFDVFFFSNLAFLQLFTAAAKREIAKDAKTIGRPMRALIWFVKSMFDYAAQGRVTFERTHSLVTFGGQTDKAGSFTSDGIRPFIVCENFIHPRIKADEAGRIISPEGVALLKPERRLDAVLIHRSMEELLNMLRFD